MSNSHPQFIEPRKRSDWRYMLAVGLIAILIISITVLLLTGNLLPTQHLLPTVAVLPTNTATPTNTASAIPATAVPTPTASPTIAPTVTSTTIVKPTIIVTETPSPNPIPDGFIIPDSELVNSPAARDFDIAAYINAQPGRIAGYVDTILGRQMTSAEMVEFVATNTSVNPRLLLALLEYESGWLSNPDPAEQTYPMGLQDKKQPGLFNQLVTAANELNEGYYGVKTRGVKALTFADGSTQPISPKLNFGTLAVQHFLAQTALDRDQWLHDIGAAGFRATYIMLFGDPFVRAIDPLVPLDLAQPDFALPFPKGETWYFAAGPHGGWGRTTSGWAAVDFAPPRPSDNILKTQGKCYVSPFWVTAVTNGIIARANDGAVVLDTDMDGDERTGWTILYLHIAQQDRIAEHTIVQQGDPIGHPSCQGFFLNSPGTHLHIARRYNGEWIPADCKQCADGIDLPPFVMGGWVVHGDPRLASAGWLENGDQTRRLMNGRDDQINGVSW